MAEAVLRMLTDNHLRNQVTVAAKHRVTTDFDNRQLIQDLAEVYRKDMEQRAKGRGPRASGRENGAEG
jgi:hypothetical protein